MITMWNKQRGIEKGIEQGIEQGVEQGIHALVDTVRELSAPKDAAVKGLVEKFGLLPHVAEEKVQQYWKN